MRAAAAGWMLWILEQNLTNSTIQQVLFASVVARTTDSSKLGDSLSWEQVSQPHTNTNKSESNEVTKQRFLFCNNETVTTSHDTRKKKRNLNCEKKTTTFETPNLMPWKAKSQRSWLNTNLNRKALGAWLEKKRNEKTNRKKTAEGFCRYRWVQHWANTLSLSDATCAAGRAVLRTRAADNTLTKGSCPLPASLLLAGQYVTVHECLSYCKRARVKSR